MKSSLLALTCICSLAAQTTTTPTSTASATGKAIGETVKSVVETVFPAITPIVELFRKKENKPAEEEKKKKEIAEQVAALKAKTKQQLAPLSELSEELRLIDTVSGNAALAEVPLARMNVLLLLPDISPKAWGDIEGEWKIALKALARILDVKRDTILDKVKDDAIQLRLLDARQIQEEASDRIASRLPAKNATYIREQTLVLENALTAARNLSTVKLARLSRDLKTIQDYLAPAQGTPNPPESIPSEYLELVDKPLAQAKAIAAR